MRTLMLLRRFSAPAAALCLTMLASGPVKASALQRVAPTYGGFSILMPGTPETGSSPVSTPYGQVTMHTYSVAKSTEAYMAAYADSPLPLDTQRALDGAVEKASAGGRVLSQAPILSNGVAGRYVVISKNGMMIYAKIYVSGKRLYQALYLSKSAGLSPEAREFFDSFQIGR